MPSSIRYPLSASSKISVIGLPVNVATYQSALDRCIELAHEDRAAAVSAANTHIASAARWSASFGKVMSGFDLILPDGMPLIWVMNAKLKRRKQPKLDDRVYGPYFMRHAILNAPPETTHYFFGGAQECLDELSAAVLDMRPDIRIVGTCSPPYRAWAEEDQQQFADDVNAVNPDFVWVALGGEKQETWIINNLHRFNRGVFFAVGDAFELLAGRRDFAPEWVQNHGVTWLYRLIQEPGRMWSRYFKYNSLFIAYLIRDWLFPSRESELNNGGNSEENTVVRDRVNILGVGVTATSMKDSVKYLLSARRNGVSGYVCVTGAHGIMESQRDLDLKNIHNRSLMTVPDGMPTVWLGRENGFSKMGRVYGPDLMLEVCKQTSALNLSLGTGHESLAINEKQPVTEKVGFTHFLYGSTEETLCKLKANLEKKFPGVQIVGTYAPPFRLLTEKEELDLRRIVADCKPDFFWVGLSTPKQEAFMAAHAPATPTVAAENSDLGADRSKCETIAPCNPLDCGIMFGVGAAFDIHAGNYKDSPEWVKNSGLQWADRLCKEPRRLWRRYLWVVPGFIFLTFLQVMGLRRFPPEAGR